MCAYTLAAVKKEKLKANIILGSPLTQESETKTIPGIQKDHLSTLLSLTKSDSILKTHSTAELFCLYSIYRVEGLSVSFQNFPTAVNILKKADCTPLKRNNVVLSVDYSSRAAKTQLQT